MTRTDTAAGRDWVVGYGSIINNLSRSATSGCSSAPPARPAALCWVAGSKGLVRCWNFRSSTGFTAVGLRNRTENEPAADICGVIFDPGTAMAAFDAREKGYHRVQVLASELRVDGGSPLEPADRVWIYIPCADHSQPASADFPILQTYVDCVLQVTQKWMNSEG